jgi:hypothetical protein
MWLDSSRCRVQQRSRIILRLKVEFASDTSTHIRNIDANGLEFSDRWYKWSWSRFNTLNEDACGMAGWGRHGVVEIMMGRGILIGFGSIFKDQRNPGLIALIAVWEGIFGERTEGDRNRFGRQFLFFGFAVGLPRSGSFVGVVFSSPGSCTQHVCEIRRRHENGTMSVVVQIDSKSRSADPTTCLSQLSRVEAKANEIDEMIWQDLASVRLKDPLEKRDNTRGKPNQMKQPVRSELEEEEVVTGTGWLKLGLKRD